MERNLGAFCLVAAHPQGPRLPPQGTASCELVEEAFTEDPSPGGDGSMGHTPALWPLATPQSQKMQLCAWANTWPAEGSSLSPFLLLNQPDPKK